jgi:hypothetical protein
MKVTFAQYVARKALKEKYYSEYLAHLAGFVQEYAWELPRNPTRQEKNNWRSRQTQRAIREIVANRYDEYRTEYLKAVKQGHKTSHNKEKRNAN